MADGIENLFEHIPEDDMMISSNMIWEELIVGMN